MIEKLENLINEGKLVNITTPKDFPSKVDKIKWIIGILGGANQTEEGNIKQIIDDFLITLKPYTEAIAIATGGTQYRQDNVPVFGVPAYGITKAHDLGFSTMGIFPERGEKYTTDLIRYLDMMVNVLPRCGESEWSDECEVLIKLIDGALIMGGSEGTLTDFAHIAKHNRTELDYERIPIYVVPIIRVGGVSEKILNIASIFKQSDEYLPKQNITTGKDATEYLIDKIGIS